MDLKNSLVLNPVAFGSNKIQKGLCWYKAQGLNTIVRVSVIRKGWYGLGNEVSISCDRSHGQYKVLIMQVQKETSASMDTPF